MMVWQGMELHCPAGEPPAALARRSLPCLNRLTGLTALNLADNAFKRVPPALAKLTGLRYLDFSMNPELQVRFCFNPLKCQRRMRGCHFRRHIFSLLSQ